MHLSEEITPAAGSLAIGFAPLGGAMEDRLISSALLFFASFSTDVYMVLI